MNRILFCLLFISCFQIYQETPLYCQFAGGSGSPADPYLIASPAHLNQVRFYLDAHFLQTADIDMDVPPWNQGVGFEPIGTFVYQQEHLAFRGSYDGQGHVISNLYINYGNLPDHVPAGLFGCVWIYGEIKNLGIEGGSVTGNFYLGALSGYHKGVITNCFSTASVNGTNYVGGLVGWNYSGEVTNSFSAGAVRGERNTGGLVGWNDDGGLIKHCYASGRVEGIHEPVGGLVGIMDDGYSWVGTRPFSKVIASFWDTETTAQPGSSGGKGLTNIEMRTLSVFQNAGWNQSEWVMSDGEYARLQWEGTGMPAIPQADVISLPGSGTEEDPYLVGSATAFASLSWHADLLNAHIRLTANIDCGGIALYPIGDLGPFEGVFNGNGFNVDKVQIVNEKNDYIGLFSVIGTSGEVKNLGLEGGLFSGRYNVGGLVGMIHSGKISNCYVKDGEVNGVKGVGGLSGKNWYGSVSNCFSRVYVSGEWGVGGFVGVTNECFISYSYSTGKVTYQDHGYISVTGGIGGFSGYYYEGNTVASYWNKTTSGQNSGGNGEGRTTADMTYPYTTNTYAGWDFNNVWTADDTYAYNDGYPYLHAPQILVRGRLYDNIDNTPLPYMRVSASVNGTNYEARSDEEGYYLVELDPNKPVANFPAEVIVFFVYSYHRNGTEYFSIGTESKLLFIRVPLTIEGLNNELNLDLDQIAEMPDVTWSSFSKLAAYNHISPLYYHTHEAFEFAREYLDMESELTGLKLIVGGSEGTLYRPTEKTILIDKRDLSRESTDRPKNREYHEFGHHIMYQRYGSWPEGDYFRLPIQLESPDFVSENGAEHHDSQWQLRVKEGDQSWLLYSSFGDQQNLLSLTIPDNIRLSGNMSYHWRVRHFDSNNKWSDWMEFAIAPVISRNHGGYLNPSSADSYIEGFAEFMGLAMSKFRKNPDPEPHIYASFGSMEVGHKAWSMEGYNEELSVCGILWSLHNDNYGISLDIKEMWDVLRIKRQNFHEYYLALKSAHPALASNIDKIFEVHGFFVDEHWGDEMYETGEAYLDINNNRIREHTEYFIDYGTPDYMAFPWMVYQPGYEIGRATNYKRPWRYSAGRHPKSYLQVTDKQYVASVNPVEKQLGSNPGQGLSPDSSAFITTDQKLNISDVTPVRRFRVKVTFDENESDPLVPPLQNYTYLTEVRMGRIAIGLPPENLNASIEVIPESNDFVATTPYIIDVYSAYEKIISSVQPYFDTHSFNLIPTGSAIDEPYDLIDGIEPEWIITDRVVPLDLVEPHFSTITLMVNPESAGTVSGQGYYEYGLEVIVGVQANDGYSFEGWIEDGILVSEEMSFSFISEHDRVLTAHFSDDSTILDDPDIPDVFLVYPNPAGTMMHIKSRETISLIQLFDMQGQLVYTDRPGMSNLSIDVGQLPRGIYLVRAICPSVIHTYRIQIIR